MVQQKGTILPYAITLPSETTYHRKNYKTSHCYTWYNQSTMSYISLSASSTECNTETSLDNTSTSNSNKSKRVLPINIACDEGRHPMQRHILALMNQIPPIHFLFLPQCYIHSETRMQMLLKILWTFPNDVNSFYEGKLPFHLVCDIAAHISILDTLLKSYWNAIKVPSKKTNNTALHLYLLSSGNGISSNNKSFKMTVKFLVKKNYNALLWKNNNGWLPIHIAAFQDASINILFLMATKNPLSIMPEK